jgi:threonine synthase
MKWLHYVKIDKVLDVTSREAIEQAIRIARSEGLFVGLSSGAVMAAFEKLKKNGALQEGDYVLIFPDHGFKYIEQFATYQNDKLVRKNLYHDTVIFMRENYGKADRSSLWNGS